MARPGLRAVIHIGAEKTGTTTLQEFLHLNRGLLAESGVVFPATPGLRQHGLLSLACLDPGRENQQARTYAPFVVDPEAWRAEFAQAFQGEVAARAPGMQALLLSSELFHTQLLQPREVARLKDLLDPFCDSYRIVFYMRRQDRLEVSRYSTNLRAGGTRASPLPERHDRYLNYEAVLARWVPVFGAASLVPRVYERARFRGGDLVADFLDAAGLPGLADGTRPDRRNTALSARAQMLLRAFNLRAPTLPWGRLPDRATVRKAVAGYLASRFPGPPMLPTRDEALAFYARYRESNARIARQWFQRDALFDEDFGAYPEQAGDPAPDAGQVDAILDDAVAHAAGIAMPPASSEHG